MLRQTGRRPRPLQALGERAPRATPLRGRLYSSLEALIFCARSQPMAEGILVLRSHFLSVGMKGQLWRVLKLSHLPLCDRVSPRKKDY